MKIDTNDTDGPSTKLAYAAPTLEHLAAGSAQSGKGVNTSEYVGTTFVTGPAS